MWKQWGSSFYIWHQCQLGNIGLFCPIVMIFAGYAKFISWSFRGAARSAIPASYHAETNSLAGQRGACVYDCTGLWRDSPFSDQLDWLSSSCQHLGRWFFQSVCASPRLVIKEDSLKCRWFLALVWFAVPKLCTTQSIQRLLAIHFTTFLLEQLVLYAFPGQLLLIGCCKLPTSWIVASMVCAMVWSSLEALPSVAEH